MENLFIKFAQMSIEAVAAQFHVQLLQGLNEQEVSKRLAEFGPNSIATKKIYWYTLLLKQMKSLFFLLFILLALLSFVFGEHLNAVIIFLCLVVSVSVGFYQEYQVGNQLESLKKYLVAMVMVLRNGKEQNIPSSGLVPGDIVVLYPGDILAADIYLFDLNNLLIDESVLTGESTPTVKAASYSPGKVTIFNAHNIGFAGTTVLSGKGFGIVFATGNKTVMSSIAQVTDSTMRESALSQGNAQLSSFITKLMIIGICLVFVANFLIKGTDVDYKHLLLFAISMAITITPQALPIVITVCLARGVKKLSQNKVIVKRLSAVEDLGAMEILCTDKTGTLTENSLEITHIYGADPDKVLFYATLTAVNKSKKVKPITKGFDYVLWEHMSDALKEKLFEYECLIEHPFDPARRRNGGIFRGPEKEEEYIVRGAPDDVLALCMPVVDQKQLHDWIMKEGEEGNRILAVAKKEIMFKKEEELAIEDLKFELVGLISFADPIKSSAIEAVRHAKRLGVDLKILSGDAPEVCYAIGKKVGLISHHHEVMTGSEFEKLVGPERREKVASVDVFARLAPAQKYEIIELLQKNKVVGYMGDGINDAPALKIADVSIAVQDAVDVAYDAANIILLKKSLRVVCIGIEEGRKIVANTLKYIRTAFSLNIGNFFSLLGASLLLDYLPMLPIQILLLNLLQDVPMLAISSDTVMKGDLQYPRRYNVHDILFICIILAIVSSAFDLIFFLSFKNYAPEILQTGWFIENFLAAFVFILSIRVTTFVFNGNFPSKTLLLFILADILVATILPQSAFGQKYFHFAPLTWHSYLKISIIVAGYFVANELVKVAYYRFYGNAKKIVSRKRV